MEPHEVLALQGERACPDEARVLDHLHRRVVGSAPNTSGELIGDDEIGLLASAYRTGGLAAIDDLRREGTDWLYYRLVTANPATHNRLLHENLLPLMSALIESGDISSWWFMRKANGGPHLRVRLRPTDRGRAPRVLDRVESDFRSWTRSGTSVDFSRPIYEPEIALFGGEHGMDVVHELFHSDSDGYCRILPWLTAQRSAVTFGVSAALFAGLFRGAELDWFEQGDVWRRVVGYRSTAPIGSVDPDPRTRANVRAILADPEPTVARAGPDAPGLIEWYLRFEAAGRALARVDRDGLLHAGIRRVVAIGILFHWNRMNFSPAEQALLAHLAGSATDWGEE